MAVPRFETIIDDLGFLEDWEDRYRYIIELGRLLDPMPHDGKTEDNKVRGCASQVWLQTNVNRAAAASPVLTFHGDSDAHIVKGLVALALALFSGKQASVIVETDAHAIFASLGLKEHLSAQRSNGFRSLIDRIRKDAITALADKE